MSQGPIRFQFSYANVMSTLAVFLALAGGTTAIALSGKNSVKKGDIAKNAVRAREIVKGGVLTGEVKNETLVAGDLGAGSVGASEILDGVVGTADLADAPAARILLDNDPASISNNVLTEIELNTETTAGNDPAFDPNDMWSPAAPTDVVVPVDGVYLVIGEVFWSEDDTLTPGGLSDQGYRQIRLTAPGLIVGNSRIDATRFDDEPTEQQAVGVVDLSSGEAISIHLGQENDDATTVTALEVQLEVVWLGPGI